MNETSRWRRVVLGIIVFLLAIAFVFFCDPINRLRVQLIHDDFTSLAWNEGFWTLEKLPAAATPEQVAQAYYSGPDFKKSGATFNIREVKVVDFGFPPRGPFTAIVVDGPKGENIFVAQFTSNGWSLREY